MKAVITGAIISTIQSQREDILDQWNNPQPEQTRHFVVDHLLPGDLCERIYHAFPSDLSTCRHLDSFRERKKTLARFHTLDAIVSDVTYAFQEPDVINLIEDITGMKELEGDPRLYAGGISIMGQGDFLNPHIDNSHDAERKRYRRLNLLYYVAPDWESASGGNFELWDDGVRRPREIVSAFNRLVVMETNKRSWHSVNPVIAEATRCCVSNYYFSKHSPTGEDYYHVTSFMGRPDQPFRRFWGHIDNRLRQTVATLLGISRGKELMADTKQTQ